MIKAVIFDCYGVLVSSTWQRFRADQIEHNPEWSEYADEQMGRLSIGEISSREFSQLIGEKTQLSSDEIYRSLHDNVPDDSLFEYIANLKKSYKIGMLSNIGGNRLDDLIGAERQKLFDSIALSFAIGAAKPDPAAYQTIATMLDVNPEECVFTDDLRKYCNGAESVGMKAILFESTNQFVRDFEEMTK